MLIEFTVGNFRSFKDPVTLSMVAAKLNSKNAELDRSNTIKVDENLTLLTSSAVYGANASGKSNLIGAFQFMRNFVINSSKGYQADEPVDIVPFRLDADIEGQPSYFEIVFRIEGTLYRYGFEVTRQKIETEWLFYSPNGREAKLFVREGKEIGISRSLKGANSIKSLTRPNALFLSVAAQLNNEMAIKIINWFRTVNIISGLDDFTYRDFTINAFSNNALFRDGINDFVRRSDVGINNIIVQKTNKNSSDAFSQDMPHEIREFLIKNVSEDEPILSFFSLHNRYNKGAFEGEIPFNLDDESEGTRKLFFLSGPLIDTLRDGKILIIDEIEARMHTLLTQSLIGLFNSKETNPNNAQLVFATHDTNLLSNKLFRRDQIWFVEKDPFGASHLYSLAEIKIDDIKIRNDRSFEKDYLLGRYGGVPVLGEMRNILLDSDLELAHAKK